MTAARCDLIVVGCGPAGISAAIWSDDLHVRAIVVESEQTVGGQLHRVYNPVENYPGLDAANGSALAERLGSSMVSRSLDVRLRSRATRIDTKEREVLIDGEAIASRFVLLATGVRQRTLDVPGASELAGRGVHGSATKHADEYRGARVVVVGGGDAALEESLILAKVCDEVTIVHRRASLSGRPDFRDRVRENPRIRLVLDARVLAIGGVDRVESVTIEHSEGVTELEVDGVFPCLGVEPNSDLVRSLVEVDVLGYVKVDDRQRTSLDWIYAAGDLCSHSSLTVAAAVGQAASAVKDISRRLSANE